MANAKVPKFGAWEGEEPVQYTAYFENARKGKGGSIVNPNDPQMNRDLHPRKEPPPRARTPPEQPNGRGGGGGGGVRPSSDQRVKAVVQFPSLQQDNTNRRPPSTNEPTPPQIPGGRGRGEPRGRPAVQQAPSESPLNARVPPRGGGANRSSDSKSSFDNSSHGTPGRARPAPRRGIQTPADHRGATVPEFGAWHKNPAQADGYTAVFNEVRKHRNGEGAAEVNAQVQGNNPRHCNNKPKRGRCFGFF